MASATCLFTFESPTEPGFACVKHSHPSVEIVFTADTEGDVIQDGVRLSYGPNQVIVHPPEREHWIESANRGCQFCVGALGCGADRLPYGVFDASHGLSQLFKEIRETERSARALRSERLDLLTGLLVLELHATIDTDVARTSRAFRIKEILDTEFKEPLEMAQLAARFYLHPDTMSRMFKKEFGQAPLAYLLRRRVDYASGLLLLTDLSVKEVAARSGFEDPFYFSRLFRKLRRSSPKEFRDANRHLVPRRTDEEE